MTKIEQLMQTIPAELDAVLITSPQNRKYYTGFSSSAGLLFVTGEAAYFLIDFRYIEAARAAIRGCEVLLLENTGEQLQALCKKHKVSMVGTENSYTTLTEFARYKALLLPVVLSTSSAADQVILNQRRYKTDAEVEKIRAAQALTEATFTHILERLRPGKTECEIALEMEFFMRRQGSENVSFDFIVVSGANSSKPHGVPTAKPIEKGDFVTMDFGAIVDGYHSDMTRTVAVGSVSERQRFVYDTVLAAQQAALAAIALGKPCSEVDQAARALIDAAGFEGCFGHGLGHSLGIEIHESPRFSALCHDKIQPNLVMTVEPGVYLPGEFGVRIEDMVYITKNGVQNLTTSPKNLMIL